MVPMHNLSSDPESEHHLFETFGVELEYMIVDRRSFKVRPIADHVLRDDEGCIENELDRGALAWSNELALHALELKTNGPINSLSGLEAKFQHDVRRINELLKAGAARLMPSAVHPFMDPYTETKLWPHGDAGIYSTFDRIFNCRGHGWGNLQSAHLNLPFCGNDEFVRLHGAIRLALPLIPALAAASPYLDGKDTGLLDSRLDQYRKNCAKIFSITAHVVPEAVPGIREYHRDILQRIYGDLAPHDPEGILRYEWTNARGAIARFDRQTIEIRVIDVQECPLADLAVLMVLVGIIKKLAFDPDSVAAGSMLPADRLAVILKETIRDGEQTTITDTDYLRCLGFQTKTLRANEVWSGLIETLPDIPDPYRGALEIILGQGTLASRMKRFAGKCTQERLVETCRALCDCLEEGRLLVP